MCASDTLRTNAQQTAPRTNAQERFHKSTNLETAQTTVKLAQYNRKLQYDAKHRNVEFRVGDRVCLNTKRKQEYGQIHYPAQGPSPTFEPRNIGPYKITKKLSPNAYELDLPKSLRIQPVIHIRYLREHHPSTEFPKNRLQHFATEFRSQDDETEQPQIEEIRGKILGRYGKGARLEYLVHWQGLPNEDDTWEPVENLQHCAEKVNKQLAQDAVRIAREAVERMHAKDKSASLVARIQQFEDKQMNEPYIRSMYIL